MIISCGFHASRENDSVIDEIMMLVLSFEENVYKYDNNSKLIIITDNDSVDFLTKEIKEKNYIVIKIAKFKKIKPHLRKLLNDTFIMYLIRNKIESLYVHTDTVFLDRFYELYSKHIKGKSTFFYKKIKIGSIYKLLKNRPKKHYRFINQNKYFGVLFFLIIDKKVINNKKLQKELFNGKQHLKNLSQYNSIKNIKSSPFFYIEGIPDRTAKLTDDDWNKIGLYHYDRIDNSSLNFYRFIPLKYFSKKDIFLNNILSFKSNKNV